MLNLRRGIPKPKEEPEIPQFDYKDFAAFTINNVSLINGTGADSFPPYGHYIPQERPHPTVAAITGAVKNMDAKCAYDYLNTLQLDGVINEFSHTMQINHSNPEQSFITQAMTTFEFWIGAFQYRFMCLGRV